ncbi:TadE family protein, partial [Phycicoccus sp.]|uniref:TadE family protein n=1 Tax=Phycicoccus sp. TaxID=1902410 RepID=UPI002BE82FBB
MTARPRARPPGRHPATVAPRAERGSTSVQMVILMPALFAVTFLGLQAALTYHARTLAIASAQEGARAAGAEHATKAVGITPARDYPAATAGDALTAA